MRIQHNIMAMSAYRNYTNNVSAMKKNLEKLSSGYKINRAGDDAAGLAISEKMRAQITGLETAQKNAKDGISLVQTAEGALTEVHDMLNRMVELATQSANGTYDNTTDRAQMQKEVNQLLDEINRIADSSNFNGINLLDGSLGLNKDAFEITQLTDTAATDVTSDIVGDIPAATGAANVVTKLHTASTSGVKGSFTINLGQANISAPASGTASFNIHVGNATITVNATAAKKALSASKVASQVIAATSANNGSGAGFFYVKANGSYGFAKSASSAAAAAGAKGLVYTGTVDGNYNVKYSLTGYVNASGTAVVNANASDLTADNVASGAFINLNFDVAIASGTKGTLTVNAGHVGTQPTNSVMKKDGQMGSTKMSFDVTKLENGMTIEINGTKKTVKVTEDGPSSANIDLSKLDKNAADYQDQAMAKIVAAFKGVAGIDVGVNDDGDLTLAEQKGAATSVTKLMEKESTFQAMVKVTKAAVSAGSSIKVTDPSAIKEGDTLSITNGGQTTKYVFTKDATKAAGTPPAGSVYVDISNAASATAVANALNTAAGGAGTVNGGTLTLTGDYSTLGRGLTLQIGDTSDSFNQLNVAVQDCHATSLGVGGLDISSETAAQEAIAKIKAAINTVSDVRGTLGATQNRLDHTINNLAVMTENIQDAESTIRDVDVAEEMMAYTKNNILIQSAQAMLAQANQVPQGVLQLLQ